MRVPDRVVWYSLLLSLSTTPVVVSTTSSAIAQFQIQPQTTPQIWTGDGYIAQGSDRGAFVSLTVKIDNNTVHFLQGQSAGQQVTFPSSSEESVATDDGEWTFPSRTKERIDATFMQTRTTLEETSVESRPGRLRMIEYTLRPENL